MIILATEQSGLARLLSEELPDDVGIAQDCQAVLENVSSGDTVIISENFTQNREDLLSTVHTLRMKDLRVIFIPSAPTNNVTKSVFHMGVWDIASSVEDGSQLLEIIKNPRTYAQASKILSIEPETSVFAAPNPVRHVQADPLVCAFTRAGGAGKSTVIAYLGAALLHYGILPGIIDLNEDKPSVARIFGLDARQGIDTIIIQKLRGDAGTVGSSLNMIKMPLKSGITVYPSSGNGLPFEKEDDVYSLYNVLQQNHPAVLADLSVRFNDLATLATIRRSSKVLFILEQYQPTLDACLRHLEEARSVGVDTEKYVLVINKYTEESRISVRKIEESLGLRASVILPLEPEKYRNEVDAHNLNPVTGQWLKLGALVANVDPREPPGAAYDGKNGGIFGFVRRRK